MSTKTFRLALSVIGVLGFLMAGQLDMSNVWADGVPAARSADSIISAKIHSVLAARADSQFEVVKAWVFFTDKFIGSAECRQQQIGEVARHYNRRAVQRRMRRGSLAKRTGSTFDQRDLPVALRYVRAVTATGARLHVTSRWLNAVSVYANVSQLRVIAELPFVDRLEPVARARKIEPVDVAPLDTGAVPQAGGELQGIDYGAAAAQLGQINLITLHEAGYDGTGIVIGILDTGFARTHEAFNNPANPLSVLAEYDFVDNDPNAGIEPGDPATQHEHGTLILGTLAAYMPGSLVGGAYGASFILCKTEDTTGEYPAEEDNYVAGLEFIEANGGDVATASLGYIDWYTQADLDGLTAVTTIAVNIATDNGLHCCTAAGNEYHDSDPATSHLLAPADAFSVIACGAVDSTGALAYFSSDGPTADGRVKPELLARGVATASVSASIDTAYDSASGTSLSTPASSCRCCLCSTGSSGLDHRADARQTV